MRAEERLNCIPTSDQREPLPTAAVDLWIFSVAPTTEAYIGLISKNGRHIHEVVSQITPPGFPRAPADAS